MFFESIAKAHGQIWSGRLQVTLWSTFLKILGLSSGHHGYGSAARPLRLQIKDGGRHRVHSLPTLPAFSALPEPYRELQSLDGVFLKVIP